MCGTDRDLTEMVIYHSSVFLFSYFLSEEKLDCKFRPMCPEGTRCCLRELHACQKVL